ncbi:MAG: hypothetical protein R3200_15660, partial [Xanthomonadales bacterium]|nr:hypothetical protein [Xanthomonadales bacterium]
PDFDPEDVELIPSGRLSLLFSGCDAASMRYATPGRILRRDLVRLTNLAGLGCSRGVSSKAGRHLTGSWYDPQRAGEGFVLEALDDGRLFMTWFTYDADGEQAWLVGEGTIGDGRSIEIAAARPVGGRFDDEFDPDEVALTDWGTITFRFECGNLSADYAGPAAFGSGSLELIPLTLPVGLGTCEG